MRKYGIAFLLLIMISALSGTAEKPNPASILAKSLEAHGGWESYAALPILSFQGSFTIKTETTTLNGSLKHIMDNNGCERFEYNTSSGQDVEGTNMDTQWKMTHDAPLTIINDAATHGELEIRKLIATFQHLYTDSNVFRLKYKGRKYFHDTMCHIIRVENIRNNNSYTYYIDIKTNIILGLERNDSHDNIRYYYHDYQPVRGFMFPMQVEMNMKRQNRIERWKFIEVECLDDTTTALFDPPVLPENNKHTQKTIDTY